MSAVVYILRCSDGSYYVGSTRGDLAQRVADHNAGRYGGYTSHRLPVTVVYSENFQQITDAVAMERRLKGWSRAKKEALIRRDFPGLSALNQSRTRSRAPANPQDAIKVG